MGINISMGVRVIPSYKPSKKEIGKAIEKRQKWLADRSKGKCADFSNMNLEGYDFHGTDLSFADFSGAAVAKANFLKTVNARYANFNRDDLTGADFHRSDIWIEDLEEAIGAFVPGACLEEGSFVAWTVGRDEKIVKLLFPEEAERCALTEGLSCAKEVEVLAVFDRDWNEMNDAIDIVNEELIYRKGEKVKTDDEQQSMGDV